MASHIVPAALFNFSSCADGRDQGTRGVRLSSEQDYSKHFPVYTSILMEIGSTYPLNFRLYDRGLPLQVYDILFPVFTIDFNQFKPLLGKTFALSSHSERFTYRNSIRHIRRGVFMKRRMPDIVLPQLKSRLCYTSISIQKHERLASRSCTRSPSISANHTILPKESHSTSSDRRSPS